VSKHIVSWGWSCGTASGLAAVSYIVAMHHAMVELLVQGFLPGCIRVCCSPQAVVMLSSPPGAAQGSLGSREGLVLPRASAESLQYCRTPCHASYAAQCCCCCYVGATLKTPFARDLACWRTK